MSDTVDTEYNFDTELDVDDFEEWQEYFQKHTDESHDLTEAVMLGTTCGGTSLSSAAISTPVDDEKDESRLTFIDDDKNAHEPDAFNIVDEHGNKLRISVYDRDIPVSLNGYSPSRLQQCEVVVSYDDETYTGFVTDTDRQYNKSLFTVTVDP